MANVNAVIIPDDNWSENFEQLEQRSCEHKLSAYFVVVYGTLLTILIGSSTLSFPPIANRPSLVNGKYHYEELSTVKYRVVELIAWGLVVAILLGILVTTRRNYTLTVILSNLLLLINMTLFVSKFEVYHFRMFTLFSNVLTLLAFVKSLPSNASVGSYLQGVPP